MAHSYCYMLALSRRGHHASRAATTDHVTSTRGTATTAIAMATATITAIVYSPCGHHVARVTRRSFVPVTADHLRHRSLPTGTSTKSSALCSARIRGEPAGIAAGLFCMFVS